MAKENKAKRIKQLTQYVGEVWVFELSKAITRGKKFLVVSNSKRRTGDKNITMWFSDEDGKILDNLPYKQLKAPSIEEALASVGYQVI